MTYGSLFAGIGGIDLGLERAGMQCVWQVENDPHCVKVLSKHWPGVPKHGDITKLRGSDLGPVDLIAGGFPCQDLSQAGKRAGITGDRSGLWFEFARIIGELGPRWVLIENVPGLLDRRAMPRVLGELARLGYVGCWFSLRASDFGASHLRKRIFIVARRALADSATGGRRERGESSRGDGFTYGNNQTLEDSGRAEQRRAAESSRLSRSRAPIHDSGASRALEHAAWDEQSRQDGEAIGMWGRRVRETGEQLADAGSRQLPQPGRRSDRRDGTRSASQDVSDAFAAGLPYAEQTELPGTQSIHKGRTVEQLCSSFAPGPGDARWPEILREFPWLAPALESPVRGMADGLPDWMDRALSGRTKRLRQLGNAVVPDCVEWIARRILELAERV
jgi:DNA-cytosine methyltransferase